MFWDERWSVHGFHAPFLCRPKYVSSCARVVDQSMHILLISHFLSRVRVCVCARVRVQHRATKQRGSARTVLSAAAAGGCQRGHNVAFDARAESAWTAGNGLFLAPAARGSAPVPLTGTWRQRGKTGGGWVFGFMHRLHLKVSESGAPSGNTLQGSVRDFQH